MTTTFRWIGQRPANLICATFKKDLPPLQPWQTAQRIQFRFETVWCAVGVNGELATRDGSMVKTTVAYAGEPLIGRNDPYQTGLDYGKNEIAFRNALDERAQGSRAALTL